MNNLDFTSFNSFTNILGLSHLLLCNSLLNFFSVFSSLVWFYVFLVYGFYF